MSQAFSELQDYIYTLLHNEKVREYFKNIDKEPLNIGDTVNYSIPEKYNAIKERC